MRIPFRPVAVQTVGVTNASASSSAFNANTTVVRLVSDTNCFVLFGTGTVTSTSSVGLFLVAGVPEYFRSAGSEKVAAIRSTADGNIYITEMSL